VSSHRDQHGLFEVKRGGLGGLALPGGGLALGGLGHDGGRTRGRRQKSGEGSGVWHEGGHEGGIEGGHEGGQQRGEDHPRQGFFFLCFCARCSERGLYFKNYFSFSRVCFMYLWDVFQCRAVEGGGASSLSRLGGAVGTRCSAACVCE